MLYLTFLSKLVGRKVYVELKSGMQMHGVLLASDNFANLSLDNPVIYGSDISFTHVSGGRRVFIRGSAIQFLYLNDVEGDESLSSVHWPMTRALTGPKNTTAKRTWLPSNRSNFLYSVCTIEV